MSHDVKHEGWSNRETWIVNLWMSNEEPLYRYATELAREARKVAKATGRKAPSILGQAMEEWMEEKARIHGRDEGFVNDLLNAALNRVNWTEIAKAWLDATPA